MNFIKFGVVKSLVGAMAISACFVPFTTSSLAQTPIGELQRTRSITIAGQVMGISRNKFVLNDGTGQILVDAGPHWWQEINLSVGEQVRVVGEYDDNDFDAFSITRQDGSVINIRPSSGPPPWAGRDR